MAISRNKEWDWMDETESRPWGMYEVLLDSIDCKVKRITVAPEQRLSYQSHKHREENWVVVKGVLSVILDDKEHTIHPGESIFIPQGSKHRAWNQTSTLVQFVEVQTGTYFGEDDIIRYEDDYKRE
jgi:mannose-6-phosphate isomerase-like protein (cupin superfamily)